MDSLERLRSQLADTACAACGHRYRNGPAQLLARRDDLVFVELHCEECGTDTLGIVELREDALALEPTYGEFSAGDEARFRSAPAIVGDDLLRVHALLELHAGSLRALVGPGLVGQDGA